MEAFVYCWTDQKTNKLYVGRHKGSIDDGYICSSKPMLAEYKIRPQDFTRQIIAQGTFEDMVKLEVTILHSVNAALNESFYNQHNGSGKFYFVGKGSKRPSYRNRGLTGTWERRDGYKEWRSQYQKDNSCFVTNNPMNDPNKRKLVSLSKLGRKRFYNEDRTQFKYCIPGSQPHGWSS